MNTFDIILILERLNNLWEIVREMAWQGTIMILIVMICRLFIGKISKKANYLLWMLVGIRLLCPMMLPSQFSIFNYIDRSGEIKTEEMKPDDNSSDTILSEYTEVTHEYTAPAFPIQGENSENTSHLTQQESQSISSEMEQNIKENGQTSTITKVYTRGSLFIACIWLIGSISMSAYGIFSYQKMKKKLRFATKVKNGVFV